ncbi:MAG: GNAT family N-acetyltransferase [Chlamydiales bacterium]|nr:GNAT family N-acetyltransferase [Chlamydiales bacterium]
MVGCGGWSFRDKLYAGPAQTSIEGNKLNPAKDPARIRAMFIDPSCSGQGIGSLILKHSEMSANAMGFTKGALGATMSGFAFYQAKGWSKISEEMALLPNGIKIKVIQMEKAFFRK